MDEKHFVGKYFSVNTKSKLITFLAAYYRLGQENKMHIFVYPLIFDVHHFQFLNSLLVFLENDFNITIAFR